MTDEVSRARFLSAFTWTKDRDDFGGYSGIVLSRSGSAFTILSDRSHIIEGNIFRYGDRILGVRSNRKETLDYPESLFDTTPKRDTEGLSIDNRGALYISMESDNRILRRAADRTWSVLPSFPAITELPLNRGLEAIAHGPDGALYAIPETSDGWDAPFPVFRFCPEKGWSVPFDITREPGLVPVGADFGPDGRLYVLERGFAGFGFFSQVRQFDLTNATPMQGTTLLETRTRQHDNLEGLAVWKTETGDLRLTMVSDDNFNRFQETEIVEYALPN